MIHFISSIRIMPSELSQTKLVCVQDLHDIFMRLEACQRETSDVLEDLVKESEPSARAAQKVKHMLMFPFWAQATCTEHL
jgi:hypothetical protein